MGATTERERVSCRVIRACAVAPTSAASAMLIGASCDAAAAAARDQALDHLASPRIGLPLSPWLIGGFAIVLVAAVWRVLRRVRRLLPEPAQSEVAPPRVGLDRLVAFGRPRVSLHGAQERAEPMFESAEPDDALEVFTEQDDAVEQFEPEPVESESVEPEPFEPVTAIRDDDQYDELTEPSFEDAPIEPAVAPAAAEPVSAALEEDEEAIASVLAFAPRRQRRPASLPVSAGQERAERYAGPSEPAPHSRADLIVVLSLVDSLSSGPAARVLARQLAASGRTILVDLEGSLKIEGAGLGALVAGGIGFADAIRREPGSRLHLIPGGVRSEVTRDGLDLVVEALCETYDFVIIAAGRPTEPFGADLAGRARFGLLVGQDRAPDEVVAEARSLFAPDCEILLAPVEGLHNAAA